VVVVVNGAPAVEVTARHHPVLIEVDPLDLADVHARRVEHPAYGAEQVPWSQASGEHLADESMERMKIVARHDGAVDLTTHDRAPQGSRKRC
jgi:hypothetical protein